MHDVIVCEEVKCLGPGMITEFPGEISSFASSGEDVFVQGDGAESDAWEERERSKVEGKHFVFLLVKLARVLRIGVDLAMSVGSQLKRRSGERRNHCAVIN